MLLHVRDLETGYQNKQVLFGVSLDLEEREIVALLGHNGAGKSTLVSAIYGLLPLYRGRIEFQGQNIAGKKILSNVQKGLVLVPGGHQVFGELSVMENLKVVQYLHKKENFASQLAEIFRIFPWLSERKSQTAHTLSGGEQQMLSIALGLLMKPKLLMLDEPSLGLAPLMVANIMEAIQLINREYHVGILLVEQNIRYALETSSRVYVMRLGKMITQSRTDELRQKENYVDLF
ncbi:MAG TPA: ATP-binding cassette domain-containing protein [Thermodesulfobacteriota bacterium]|nr:ATP-binding cassette domain-containing protein [Thermodesulfobacteriota bacterium]